MIEAKIIEDSINENGVRLTTMQLKYQRFIHAEAKTHRILSQSSAEYEVVLTQDESLMSDKSFSRNASSSRAIPVAKMIEQVCNDPAMPVHWGKNQSGMQAKAELVGHDLRTAKALWRDAAIVAADLAEELASTGAHKQIVNRILEPFQWIHVVVTATEWENFYALRDHPDTQPEIQALAQAMKAAHDASTPKLLKDGEWHIPYVSQAERDQYSLKDTLKFSAARCARVSYLNHDQSNPTPEKDIDLHDKLVKSVPAHMSPVEHQAQSRLEKKFYANFNGFKSYRKYLEEM